MIHIDRSRVERPTVFDPDPDSPIQREVAEARKFYRRHDRGQKRFPFMAFARLDIKAALLNLFYGKCA